MKDSFLPQLHPHYTLVRSLVNQACASNTFMPVAPYCSPTWSLHPLVMVGVYAYFILFKIKSIFTVFNCLKFMMTMKVRPTPQTAVNNMRQSFTVGYLQAAIERPKGRKMFQKNIQTCLQAAYIHLRCSEMWGS